MQSVSLEAHGEVQFTSSLTVLEDVHLRLVPGLHGLVGANGAGKSTLLRVLAGDLPPRAGSYASRRPARPSRRDAAPIPRHRRRRLA